MSVILTALLLFPDPVHATGRDFINFLNSAGQKLSAGDRKGAVDAYYAAIKEASDRRDLQGLGVAYNMLCAILINSGEYQTAIKLLKESIKVSAQGGDNNNRINALNQISAAYSGMGDMPSAISSCLQSLELSIKTGHEIGKFNSLAMLELYYRGMGDYSKALEYSQRLVKAAIESGNKEREAEARLGMAATYNEIGDFDSALKFLEKARKTALETKDESFLAQLEDESGVIYGNMREYDLSIPHFSEAIRLYKKMKNRYIGAELNMAEALMGKGDISSACGIYARLNFKIGVVRCSVLNKDYTKGINLLDEFMPKQRSSRGSNILLAGTAAYGLCYEGLANYGKAESYYRKGLELAEQARSELTNSSRLYYLSGHDWLFPRLESYEGLVRVSPFTNAGIRGSFYYSEFTKGRIFTEMAAGKYGEPETRIPANVAKKEKAVNSRVASAAKQLERTFLADNRAEHAKAKSENSAAIKEKESFLVELRREHPEYASALYPAPVYPEGVPLSPDEALIEYEVTGPYSKVFLVKAGTVAFSGDIRLTRPELNALVKRYRSYFENVDSAGRLASYDPALGNRLYELLLKPVLEAKDAGGNPLVRRSDRIIIVPDEILGILPFESLVVFIPPQFSMPTLKYGPVPVGITYVADSYDILYAYSAAAVCASRTLKSRAPAGNELLVVADPVFSLADSRLGKGHETIERTASAGRSSAAAILRQMGISGSRPGISGKREKGSEEDFAFPRLDKTGLLADILSKKVFPEASSVLSGLSASEDALSRTSLSAYKYIVVATHGILEKTIPYIREPALVLSQLGNHNGQDGFLTLSEVMRLKLNAEVVALTACQTNLGKSISGEGVMSMGRGFQYAGAKSVLVTLWNVSEDSTTKFAESFFRNVKAGKTAREAMRLAREDIRKEGYEHPFFWSPFMLIE